MSRCDNSVLSFLLLSIVLAQNAIAMKIAIIGGGVSGTSSAYFLRQALGQEHQIDLFEGGRIGGRLSTIKVDNCEYETGGAVIHGRNKYAADFAGKFGIKQIKSSDNEILGIYNESEFLFTGSENSLWNTAKILWRYGFDLVRLQRYTADMLRKFDKVYEIQSNHNSFSNLDELMNHIHPTFLQYMRISTKDGFRQAGYSDRIINELIDATLRCNYGQTTSVHQFVGSVSIAGADNELFALEGGNKLLPEKFYESSKAKLISEFVENVKLDNEKFILKTKSFSNVYDFVIVSTPLTADPGRRNAIKFENFPFDIKVPGRYWTTICTIVKGSINPKFFGLKSRNDVPSIIINVSEKPVFNSIGKLAPVKKCQEEEVWKIFSVEILDRNFIDELFSEVSFIQTIDWLAYPSYDSSSSLGVNFTLYHKLFYPNAMEWSASAIETSIIGARNVALLVENILHNRNGPTSHEFKFRDKVEL